MSKVLNNEAMEQVLFSFFFWGGGGDARTLMVPFPVTKNKW